MKTLYCKSCDCIVAEITSGSRIMIGSTIYCSDCSREEVASDSREYVYNDTVVDNLMNILRGKTR